MNGEVPSVPITTLAGVSSLVDLLPEMPLPTPLPQTLSNKSLLFHPRVAEEAQRQLVISDDNLVQQLVQCLSQTSCKDIDLKEPVPEVQLDHENSPRLLQGILRRKPDVFSGKRVVRDEHSQYASMLNQSNHENQLVSPSHSHLFLPRANHIMDQSHTLQSAPLPMHSPMHLSQTAIMMHQAGVPLHHSSHMGVPHTSTSQSLHMESMSQLTLQAVAAGSSQSSSSYGSPHTLPHSSPHQSQLPLHHLVSGIPSNEAPVRHSPAHVNNVSPAGLHNDRHKEHVPTSVNNLENQNSGGHSGRLDKPSVSSLPQVQIQLKPLDTAQIQQLVGTPGISSENGNNARRPSKSETVETSKSETSSSTKLETPTRGSTRAAKNNQVKAEPEPSPEEPKKKVRKLERMLVPVLEKIDMNMLNIHDSSTYHRFIKLMDIVLDSMEDCNLDEIGEDDPVPDEDLVPKNQLAELCSEAAKLKALNAMDKMPEDKILKLLSILEKNIRNGTKVTPLVDPDETEEDSKLWIEISIEKINRAALASLAALHILTSPNIPKKAYLEELIDRIAIFTKFQLQNTIFPSFDPVYRIDKKSKSNDGFSSSKKKRAHAAQVRDKSMKSFYNKMHELVGLLAELLNIQTLTDTTVLHLSTLGVSPFFVENVPELQLSALKLVTNIFTQYEKHRRLLLDDILASIARLPSSKRGLRTFKLENSEECIQMLTALVLQLIQCVTNLPGSVATKALKSDAEELPMTDKNGIVLAKYDIALRTAGSFLQVFLSKCGSKSEDCDYKVLFENFVHDLLSTVNKPQWPAAELLLTLLGTLLVKNVTNKSCEVSLRVASLEYLGLAASRLRKDAVSSQAKMDQIDRIIADIRAEEEQLGESADVDGSTILGDEEEKTKYLQRLLLDYLAVHGQSDSSLLLARHFYITSWWKTAEADIKVKLVGLRNKQNASKASRKRKRKNDSSGEESESESEGHDEDDKDEMSTRITESAQKRREFLSSKVHPFSDPLTKRKTKVVQTFVDYQSAELITRYLASQRSFSTSFDSFLHRILSVACEPTVAIRTKALKCLTMVVEADPNVLARTDMQLWVEHSFLDQSTSVREAAVDLVGKYVLSCYDLIDKYYPVLSLRILDTGVSVRKRVIKILRDICAEYPAFPKIPEICVKMIRRVNDEDGIRKLVMEVFQNLWFTPVKENPLDTEGLLRKVSNITDVVASCESVGLDFFEQLLLSLFKPKDDKEDVREKQANPEPPKALVTASTQIVDCLVESVLRLEESNTNNSSRFIACVSTLYLFAKIRPQLLVNHAITLEGYLSLRCQNQVELLAVANIGKVLELVVPLLVNPSESFLGQLEEDCIKLILSSPEKGILNSCMACLGSVVNRLTHNYKLVRDIFKRVHTILVTQTEAIRANIQGNRLPDGRPHPENRANLRKCVYVMGLFLRYFDFTDPKVYEPYPADIVNQVFSLLMYIINLPHDDNLKSFSLQSIGNLCVRHYTFMLENDLKSVYQQLLSAYDDTKLKVQVLINLQLYLTEEELRMIKQDQEWNKLGKIENLKEMGDVTSGMASTIVQIYLKEILSAFLHSDLSVRLASVRVIQLVLQQGLVHPIQIVPYLICMSTDPDPGVNTTADNQLKEMEKKHPQFLQSQVLNGIRLSLHLQRTLHGYRGSTANGHVQLGGFEEFGSDSRVNIPTVRGYRQKPKEAPVALNGFLYSLLRSIKPQRRAIVMSMLRQFDDNKNGLADLLYYADNLAYFPYQVVDEPLFIIHHIDIFISVSGSNLLQAFKEALIPLHPKVNTMDSMNNSHYDPLNPLGQHMNLEANANDNKIDIMEDDEDEEDIDSLVQRVPENTSTLESCIIGSQGCLLLLMLKQHLKDTYGLTDSRISGYSPSDATKAFERPVNRRNVISFEPKCTLDNLNEPLSGATPEGRKQLMVQYLHFKQLMLRIDPEDGDEDGEAKPVKLKIDQSMLQYPKSKKNETDEAVSSPPSGTSSAEVSPIKISMNQGYGGQYSVMQPPRPVAAEPAVKVPKLTIVPLKFPGSEVKKEKSHKEHKVKEHNHHHKSKKSKHKKKKRAYVSDDDDSDHADSDPDFHI